mmetsp:Transcript_14630/g.22605  ORF Transcript_14630/g.22605 Transcript_14630/m.22605 type:complete len:85 (-) Transcript_14630:410-664(-)
MTGLLKMETCGGKICEIMSDAQPISIHFKRHCTLVLMVSLFAGTITIMQVDAKKGKNVNSDMTYVIYVVNQAILLVTVMCFYVI